MKRRLLLLALAVCLVFGLRALLLIDATALWSDELYSVGKSFQPSFSRLMAMLREDTHPPEYYTLLWLWGHLVGQNPISLRLLSWLASSGPLPKLTRKMQPMQEQVEREGYTCRDRSGDLSYARLLQCQSAARVLR